MHISTCYAGKLSVVMKENGDIYACEDFLNTRIGNIREWNYDFKKALTSLQAEKIRRNIAKSKCFCTYECALTANILFNPKYYPKMLKKYTDFI